MLKHMDDGTVQRCLSAAADSPLSRDGVEYPEWYLHRWHFLPEGYLSRRSAAMYEWCIRRVYYVGAEKHALDTIRSALCLQHPEQVLELGCGPGHALEAIADALPYSEVTGVDLSPFQLERARARCSRFGGRVRVMHGDAINLPHPDSSFEAIVAAHVAGHLPGDTTSALLGEAVRVLKPRGKLYLLEHRWHAIPHGPFRQAWSRRLHRLASRLICFEKPATSLPDYDGEVSHA